MSSTDRSIGPEIEGLTYLEHLGSGGYSDVYLYERRKPRMRVAVKVLTGARLSPAELRQFAAEAETMAELADHPYIVQVFSTGTTGDGRPYLVMKYYPPPNLARRASTERFSVAEVLRTGIQVASAVETAHRAGILHRDIKPANILISQYGEPGLADFGIAGNAAETEDQDDLGVSIPWSPPEVLTGVSNGSVVSDVYSLAATLWHLLAGRSPHEAPGGDNSPRALMGRILKSAPPATGRADAPASLERLLQQSMAKNPDHRPASALEFARSLQMIEQELRYTRTEILVDGAPQTPARPAAAPTSSPEHNARFAPTTSAAPSTRARPATPSVRDEPATRARPLTPSVPDEPATRARPLTPPVSPAASAAPVQEPATRARPATPGTPTGRERQGLTAQTGDPATVRRPTAPGAVTPTEAASQPDADRKSRTPWYLGGAAAVVVAGVVIGVALSGGGSKDAPSDPTPSGPVGTDQGGLQPTDAQAPTIATPTYDAKTHVLTFRWSAPPVAGKPARFIYSLGGKQVGPTEVTSASITTTQPAATCISVGTVGANGQRQTSTACGTS